MHTRFYTQNSRKKLTDNKNNFKNSVCLEAKSHAGK